MGLLDDLSNDAAFGKAQSLFCGVCVLLKELSDKEAQLLQKRLDDDKISHTSISKVLKNNGHPISDNVIGRHRRKVCSGVSK